MTTPPSSSSPTTPPPAAAPERTAPPTAPVPAPPPPKPDRPPAEVIRDIETERAELVSAVADLRSSAQRAGKKAARVALVVPALFATGIVLGTAARIARRKHEPEPEGVERLRLGRWSLNQHDDD